MMRLQVEQQYGWYHQQEHLILYKGEQYPQEKRLLPDLLIAYGR